MEFSPSQIKNYLRCPRLWALHSVYKVRPKPTERQQKAFSFGTTMHAFYESYLKEGTIPTAEQEEAALVRASIEAVDWGGTWQSEVTIKNTIRVAGEHHTLRGIVDAFSPDRLWVRDFKSTSDYRYMPSPEEMARDPQPIYYLRATGSIRAEWMYHKKGLKTPKPPRIATWEPTKQELERSYSDYVLSPITKMVAIGKRRPNPFNMLEPSTEDPCNAYGGCVFKNVCTTAKLGGDMSKLFDNLKKKYDAPEEAAKVIPPEAEAEEAATPEPPQKKEEAPKKRGRPKGSTKKAPTAEPKAAAPEPTGKPTIYVGCLPHGEAVVRLELTPIYQAAEEAVAEAQDGLPWALTDYAKGPPKLALAIQNRLDEIGLPPEGVFIDKFGPVASVVVPLLARWGCRIVQGV